MENNFSISKAHQSIKIRGYIGSGWYELVKKAEQNSFLFEAYYSRFVGVAEEFASKTPKKIAKYANLAVSISIICLFRGRVKCFRS